VEGVTDGQLAVHQRIEQAGVAGCEAQVVVHQGDVVPAHGRHGGGIGEVQKLVSGDSSNLGAERRCKEKGQQSKEKQTGS